MDRKRSSTEVWGQDLPGMPGGVFRYFPLKCWITTSHFSVDSILWGETGWDSKGIQVYIAFF